MLKPSTLSKGDIMAMDRAYIDYEKLQQLTEWDIILSEASGAPSLPTLFD